MSTITNDDAIIKKMSTICKSCKSDRITQELEDLGEPEDLRDPDVYDIAEPLNKDIRELFELCERIRDEDLRDSVMFWLEDCFQVTQDDCEYATQEVMAYCGWTAFDLGEAAEVSFDEYLRSHSLDAFETSIH